MNAGKYEGTWDIVIAGTGITGLSPEIHQERGMIYGACPNPLTDELKIFFGVFRRAEVSLLVFDLQGKMLAELKQGELNPGKYESTWKPVAAIPSGVYFIVLKTNDLQVHYLKVVP